MTLATELFQPTLARSFSSMQGTNAQSHAVAQPRRYPAGTEVFPDGSVSFRVWAPSRAHVTVVIDDGASFSLSAEGDGYFSGPANDITPGTLYRLRLDDETR